MSSKPLVRQGWRFASLFRSTFNLLGQLVLLFVLGALQGVSAAEVQLAWDAVADSRVAVYEVHYGSQSRSYGDRLDSTTTSASVPDLQAGSTYFFAVKACDSTRAACSAYSDEVSTTIPAEVTPAPVADFSANPASGTAPLSVQFTDGSTNATAWSWNFGDVSTSISSSNPNTSEAQNPTHTYKTPGIYTVRLDAKNSRGTTSAYASINVTEASGGTEAGEGGDGLVAAYNFEEASGAAVVDASGQGNHGTISGAARTSAGKFGWALSFDGVDDWVTVNDSNSLDLTNSMTLMAWVYPTDTMSGWRAVVNKEQPGGFGAAYYLAANSDLNQPEVAVYTASWNKLYGGPALSANQWVHLAGTYDGTTLRLYVNGTQVSSQPQAGGIDVTNGVLRIGGNSYWGEFFKGLIDEIRVYNRALSATEILTEVDTAVVTPPAPSKVAYTFTTEPSGLSLTYDGKSQVTPFTVDAEVGSQHEISAPTSQQDHTFSAWSDGGAATHTITIGSTLQTLTATYVATTPAPVANFSANATTGPAPLLVNFTNASTNATTWSWSFGDGTSSDAQHPAKSYSSAGTYTVSLTATGPGGSHTAVKINYITVNEPAPVASFTADKTSGDARLLVNFTDTSKGVINENGRRWDLGDGSSAEGSSVTHTYAEPGTYSVKLTVTGPGGSDSEEKLDLIKVSAATPVADVVPMEVGEVEVDHQWQRVSFKRQFVNPIVVANPIGSNDSAPAVVRVTGIDQKGFLIRVQEWDYLFKVDYGWHSKEVVGYVVMEAGRYTLANGAQIEAGSLSTSKTNAFVSKAFSQAFGVPPVVLAAVNGTAEADAVTARLRRISASGFEVGMREQEANRQSHKTERIDYIAWSPSAGEVNGMLYEVGSTGSVVTHVPYLIESNDIALDASPIFVAKMQTTNGGDTAELRWDEHAFYVWVAEEQSKDSETSHVAESVGYLLIEPPASE